MMMRRKFELNLNVSKHSKDMETKDNVNLCINASDLRKLSYMICCSVINYVGI